MRFSLFVLSLSSLPFLACGGSVSTDPSTSGGTDDTGTVTIVDGSGGDTTAATDTSGGTTPGETGGTTSETGGTTGMIKCGMTTCDGATQDCCATMSGATCVDKGKCMGGATVSCSDSTMCPSGDVCCAERSMTGGTVSCMPASMCMGLVLCATDAECKTGQKCMAVFGGYKTCRTPFGGDAGGFDGGFKFDGGGFFDTGAGG